MSINLLNEALWQAPNNVTVTETDKGLVLDGRELSEEQLVGLLRHLQKREWVVVANNAATKGYITLHKAVEAGDTVAGARALIGLNLTTLPKLGVRPCKPADLSKMGRREDAAEAARASADALEAYLPLMEDLPETVQTLRRTGTQTETFEVLRKGYDNLNRQVGTNQLGVLPVLREAVSKVVDELSGKAAVNPLVEQSLESAVDYLAGAAVRGAETRKRTTQQTGKTEAELRQKVEAEAREEGREEMATAFSDKLASTFNKK